MDARKSARAAELLEVATRLFAERGYDGVSIRDICAALKVNSSIISYYFGGKQGLYREVLRAMFNAREEMMLTAAAELSPLEKLAAVIEAAAALEADKPFFTALMAREMAAPSPEFIEVAGEINAKGEDGLAGIIRDGQRQGLVRRGLRADVVAVIVRLLLNGAGAAPAGGENDYFQAVKTIALEGLAAPADDGGRPLLGKQSARPRGPLGR